jgi:hypothetical protein
MFIKEGAAKPFNLSGFISRINQLHRQFPASTGLPRNGSKHRGSGLQRKSGFITYGAGEGVEPRSKTCEAGDSVKPKVTEGVLPPREPWVMSD